MSIYRMRSYDTPRTEGGHKMKNLKISVGKETVENAMVSCRKVSVSKKLFNKLFGKEATITIITPGNSVKSIEICDVKKGDKDNAIVKP